MKVKCPHCGKQADFDIKNKFRPFCSQRCSTLDLGAWADEKYRVPVGGQELSSVNENDESAHVIEGEIVDLTPPKDHQN